MNICYISDYLCLQITAILLPVPRSSSQYTQRRTINSRTIAFDIMRFTITLVMCLLVIGLALSDPVEDNTSGDIEKQERNIQETRGIGKCRKITDPDAQRACICQETGNNCGY
ncbi:uncharacterized protein LOC144364015 [Saccoglossus kowalevskii]